jgi:K+-transporting ATPase A subunit
MSPPTESHRWPPIAVADGNMEGKEVRFGIFNSTLFATITNRRFMRRS